MAVQEGLTPREATAALRAGTAERLQLAFSRGVEVASKVSPWDSRDAMIDMTPYVDCARRLGLDPAAVLGPIADAAPDWYRATFAAFVKRTDWTLAVMGWSVVDTPDGPAYRFAWPRFPPLGPRR